MDKRQHDYTTTYHGIIEQAISNFNQALEVLEGKKSSGNENDLEEINEFSKLIKDVIKNTKMAYVQIRKEQINKLNQNLATVKSGKVNPKFVYFTNDTLYSIKRAIQEADEYIAKCNDFDNTADELASVFAYIRPEEFKARLQQELDRVNELFKNAKKAGDSLLEETFADMGWNYIQAIEAVDIAKKAGNEKADRTMEDDVVDIVNNDAAYAKLKRQFNTISDLIRPFVGELDSRSVLEVVEKTEEHLENLQNEAMEAGDRQKMYAENTKLMAVYEVEQKIKHLRNLQRNSESIYHSENLDRTDAEYISTQLKMLAEELQHLNYNVYEQQKPEEHHSLR